MSSKGFFAIILLSLVLFSVSGYAAEKAKDGPGLEDLMEELFKDLKTLNEGLFKGNFAKVEKAAREIADHPQVRNDQRAVIAQALGPKMAQFKLHDNDVHDSALALAEAAKVKDTDKMMTNYSKMVMSCVACHTQFRSAVVKAFKEKKIEN